MSRKLPLLVSLLLGLAVLGTLVLYAGRSATPQDVTLVSLQGEVLRVRGELEERGAVGMTLEAGDEVRTGASAEAVLGRGDSSRVRLMEGTTVRLTSIDDGVVELDVQRGRVLARVRPDAGAVRLVSRGRSLLATDAEFEVGVEEGGTLGVQATRGEVAVGGLADVSRVGAGERLVALPDGSSTLGRVSDELLLQVDWPTPKGLERVFVQGTTEPGAWVRAQTDDGQGQPVQAKLDGSFVVEVLLAEGRNDVTLSVSDAFGRERLVHGEVVRDQEGPVFRLELGRDRR